MLFRMTQDDIDLATRGDSANCPIALCLRRTLMEQGIPLGPGLLASALPAEVKSFAAAFDRGEHVEPLQFEAPLTDGLVIPWNRRS
jgi:hypothetical protein